VTKEPTHNESRLTIAFESARISYSDFEVDFYNSGVNQILGVAASRGHDVVHFRMADLYRHDGAAFARVSVLRLREDWDGAPHDAWQALTVAEARSLPLEAIQLCFARGDEIRRDDTPNLDILRELERHATLIEPVDATLATCDKYELARRCPHVPQPVTYTAESLPEALDSIRRLPNREGYFVVKDRYGYGCGAQVHRVSFQHRHVENRVHEYLRLYETLLLQEYCPEVRDGDIAVTFFDHELIGALHRRPKPGQWKTNASLGAEETRHELTPEQERIAWEVRRAFPECRLCSVDLLLSGKVLEINAFPGGKGLLRTHGIVLGDRVVKRLESELQLNKSGLKGIDTTA